MSKETTGRLAQPVTLRERHDKASAELDRYRLLVESIQDYAIFLMDANGYIQTWNKGAERNKGYKPNEIIGKHFSIFYMQRDIDARKPERELELATRLGRIEDEDWRLRKDGTRFWANVVITALRDPDGDLVGFAKVTRDLTERKQHEDELRDANTLLRQQQRTLEDMNRSKDEFISLASHQLRTPATGIKQYLGLILEGFMGEVTPEQHASILKAYESNERQLDTVNSLLRIAQIDAGKITLHKISTDIGKMLESVMDEYKEKFTRRNQSYNITVPPDTMAEIDATHFRMVIENLVDNASKYTPDGGSVDVQAKIKGKKLVITIKDSGVGVEASDIPRLFQKFSRIQNDLSESVGGTGLGLYWVEKIVALHGGAIEVKSVVGKGTLFTVSVPVK